MRKYTRLLEVEKIPTGTAQQRKIAISHGRARSYPSKSLENTRRVYDNVLKRAGAPPEPFHGSVKITVSFIYGTSVKKNIRQGYKTTRPDLDNVYKPFQDALVRNGYLEEDSRVVQLDLQKRWGATSQILLIMEELDFDGVGFPINFPSLGYLFNDIINNGGDRL